MLAIAPIQDAQALSSARFTRASNLKGAPRSSVPELKRDNSDDYEDPNKGPLSDDDDDEDPDEAESQEEEELDDEMKQTIATLQQQKPKIEKLVNFMNKPKSKSVAKSPAKASPKKPVKPAKKPSEPEEDTYTLPYIEPNWPKKGYKSKARGKFRSGLEGESRSELEGESRSELEGESRSELEGDSRSELENSRSGLESPAEESRSGLDDGSHSEPHEAGK